MSFVRSHCWLTKRQNSRVWILVRQEQDKNLEKKTKLEGLEFCLFLLRHTRQNSLVFSFSLTSGKKTKLERKGKSLKKKAKLNTFKFCIFIWNRKRQNYKWKFCVKWLKHFCRFLFLRKRKKLEGLDVCLFVHQKKDKTLI